MLARRGLRFTGTTGRQRLIRRGLVGARRRGAAPAAFAFFCVKAPDMAGAIRAARPWIGPKTVVVSLENGLGHERLLRRAFGPARVVVGVCYVAADRTGPRAVAHNGGKDIRLGLHEGRNEAAARAAAAALRAAGWRVAVEPSEDVMLWTKLCFNGAGNPLGAICAVPNGEIVRDPALRDMMMKALGEAVAAARADGHAVDSPRMREMMLKTYPADSRQRNSMLQDLQAGRRTEVDAIVGPILAAARRRRVRTPLLSRLYRVVKKLEVLR
jgi:2-dehydropantoate 2-reductase